MTPGQEGAGHGADPGVPKRNKLTGAMGWARVQRLSNFPHHNTPSEPSQTPQLTPRPAASVTRAICSGELPHLGAASRRRGRGESERCQRAHHASERRAGAEPETSTCMTACGNIGRERSMRHSMTCHGVRNHKILNSVHHSLWRHCQRARRA
ncbi:hypothetical protein NDU88_000750 [Pleurodeles waltl]|uniref:Uncharacterized protein n=1 Tax=Pleurodeles waltl TaxID=8319 RepID=A0AAV7SAY0_PLEWA|nr:hypothetical protein NDU88_000750 [Pleurodeles waltl]